jgi:hypothetical protein
MKKLIKKSLNRGLDAIARRTAKHVQRDATPHPDRSLERPLQVLLTTRFQDVSRGAAPPLAFSDVEFSAYSQNGEDGILLYIFAMIGTVNRKVVEVCAGDGVECNAANLIINHGWTGLLLDGNPALIARGKKFYATRTNAWRLNRLPPALVHAWITVDNVNELFTSHGMSGEIDLLSIDMDGNDYWIWKAIDAISPRVVIAEYNNRWGADRAVTVPYTTDFVARGEAPDGEGYFGASLPAFVALAAQKGYRLVGANSPNTNAFFMRNDVGTTMFPGVSAETCLTSRYAAHQRRTKLPLIENLPWSDVGIVGMREDS